MLRYIPHVRNKTCCLLFLPTLPTRINTSITSLKLVIKQKAFTSRQINLLQTCTFNQTAAHPYRTALSAEVYILGKTALAKQQSMSAVLICAGKCTGFPGNGTQQGKLIFQHLDTL